MTNTPMTNTPKTSRTMTMHFRNAGLGLLLVGITLSSAFAGDPPIISDGLSGEQIRAAYDRYTPAICLITYSSEITNSASGEITRRNNRTVGLIVDSSGLVMAHGHMVLANRKPFNIKITVGEGDDQKEFEATALRKPDDINVTFLKIDSEETLQLPTIEFDAQNTLELGAPIFFVGILSSTLDFTRGIQTRRIGAVLDEPRKTFCLDQPVSFAYIGGPVMDARGRAVGVLGFDLSTEEGGELYTRNGHPLVYQAALFQRYIDNPPGDEEESEDAYLGVFTQPLTDDLAQYWGLEQKGGIVVSTVIFGSPADAMGLKSGDVMTSFNGRTITAKKDKEVLGFTKMVRESPIGTPLLVTVTRDGRTFDMKLTLSTRPKTARDALEYEDTVLGLTVREITTDVRIAMNLSSDVNGVIVHRIRSGSPANQARMAKRVIVLRVGDEDISSVEEFEQVVEGLRESQPEEISLFCRIGANTGFFRLRPRWTNEN